MTPEPSYLSLRNDDRRVKRDERTLQRWMAEGMRAELFEGAKYIELPELLAWYRKNCSRRREASSAAVSGHRRI